MKQTIQDCLLAADNPIGKRQRRLFPRKRAGAVLTREQVKAIRTGRKLLRAEMRENGVTKKEDFELTASGVGLYMDKSRAAMWLQWLFFGRGLPALLGSLLLLLAALGAMSVVSQLRGHFTISMSDKMFKSGFVLSETADFKNATTNLFSTPAERVPCISFVNIPANIDEVDGEHNDCYFAYTFYIRNEGDTTVDYEWVMKLNSESRNLSSALWVMIFEDGQMDVYAKPGADGEAEALPALTDNSRGYLRTELMALCRNFDEQFCRIDENASLPYYRMIPYSFAAEDVVARGVQTGVAPGQTHKYTVVIWLEGDDPDCTDDRIGGHAGMSFDFNLLSDGTE